jgi:dinuclear metal center YbgI/SA1388 family protein
MNTPKISDILGIINKKFPFSLAENWDNTGFQLGSPSGPAQKIMVALDPLPEVIEQAISAQCQLLITHHPLIFSPLRQITTTTATGKLLLQAADGQLSLISMHTNYDIAAEGLNDILAKRIGLQNIQPLRISRYEELVKLVVFVPKEHLSVVRDALFQHTEPLGNYRNCTISAAGYRTFQPLKGAQPTIGEIGKLETVEEQRLELLVRKERLSKTIRTLLSVHPYEEPAFDCYPLLNETIPYGLGRIGRLAEPLPLKHLADRIICMLGCTAVRLVGNPSRTVQKVAVCSGSGASLLQEAVRAGADLLLTGDIKYHDAREALMLGITLIDAGHFPTERIMVEAVLSFLETSLAQNNFRAELLAADTETDPFTTVMAQSNEGINMKENQ